MPAIPEKGWMNLSLFVALSGRRKCRSQTSDNNMGRWKSRGSKSQRREEQKKEDQRRERVRRKEMHVRENVEKSQFTVFFRWFVAPEGRKVGSLKKRVRSHLARWEMKKCTPLWRAAHFQIKMYETHHSRTTFETWHVKKVHAIVARSTFSQVKGAKNDGYGALLDVQMSLRVAGAADCARCQKWAKRAGFVAMSTKTTTTLHSTPLQLQLHYITLH